MYNCWLENKFQTDALLLYAVFCGICMLVRFSHSMLGIIYLFHKYEMFSIKFWPMFLYH